jgi:cobalt-zinc-cadmium resistance protein CzcA
VQQIPGAADFKVQQISGLPSVEIVVDQGKIARYGINSGDVMQVVEAIGGLEISTVLEGQRRFELVVKLSENATRDVRAISELIVTTSNGGRVPLGSIATVREVEGPAEISHLNSSRLIVVEGNVRGRDIGSFVGDVRQLFQGKISLPPGYRPEFGGQFENLERARTRLFIVVPLALFLILLLLFTTFNSLRHALLVFTGVPLAAVGGVLSLLLRGMPFSISAGVGFIALFGVAVLNGLVMVSYINSRRSGGVPLLQAIREGAMTRLRPVLMTALVASLGFIPMAVSTGSGAEVQRPLATVVIGGLISSTILTLLVLPVLYEMIETRFTQSRPELA